MIPFNKSPYVGTEERYIKEAIDSRKISGDGNFTRRCQDWLENAAGTNKALLTTSATAALEMSALLCDIKPGDEVIMPSYTFVSTANAFVLRGASIVFVDIRPDTMNIDEKLIEEAVTRKTKAIVPVHYAGVSCEMDTIMDIAARHDLKVIEDAAQGCYATYKGKMLGSIGHLGCYSFHETKNYSMGEGGALLINQEGLTDMAEIIREKGTNRNQFFRGEVDKYSWVERGSSYLPSELNAAYLWAQLEVAGKINDMRLNAWKRYHNGLQELETQGYIELPFVPSECEHNGHMFYLKVKDLETRTRLLAYLKENGIYAVFHYVPLHSSEGGRKYGRFFGEDRYTTKESNRLVRLPMYYGLTDSEIDYIIEKVQQFFKEQR